jgi:hypothetical protein
MSSMDKSAPTHFVFTIVVIRRSSFSECPLMLTPGEPCFATAKRMTPSSNFFVDASNNASFGFASHCARVTPGAVWDAWGCANPAYFACRPLLNVWRRGQVLRWLVSRVASGSRSLLRVAASIRGIQRTRVRSAAVSKPSACVVRTGLVSNLRLCGSKSFIKPSPNIDRFP